MGGGVGEGRGAEQRSARQLCAAKLWHTKIVCGNCAPHIVCQNSARQLCAAFLRRTLCASTVRRNCAPQTCGAHCVPEQCATTVRCILAAHIVGQNSAPEKKFAYEKRVCGKRAANISRKRAASLRHICGLYIPETLYFGKGAQKDFNISDLYPKFARLGKCFLPLRTHGIELSRKYLGKDKSVFGGGGGGWWYKTLETAPMTLLRSYSLV